MTAELIRQTINLLLEAQKPTRDSLIKRQVQQMLRQVGPNLKNALYYDETVELGYRNQNLTLIILLRPDIENNGIVVYDEEDPDHDELFFYHLTQTEQLQLIRKIAGIDLGVLTIGSAIVGRDGYSDLDILSIEIAPNSPLTPLTATIPILHGLPHINLLTWKEEHWWQRTW